MTMKSTGAVIIFLAALAAISGCQKDDASSAVPPPLPATAGPLHQLFADNLVAATQHFIVNVDAAGASVQGSKGVFATFGPHAFRHADGSMVTGPVDIDLVEALRVGDMLWLNKRTWADNGGLSGLLVSGGQFRLQAFQNGEALKLATGSTYMMVPTPTAPDPDMAVFSGAVDDLGTVTWTTWPDNPIVDTTLTDSVPGGGGFYYGFTSDSLNWINCDYFYGSSSPLTGIQVTCPPEYDHTHTMVWIVFPDLNSMMDVYGGTGNIFTTGSGYEMPIGLNITVVALSEVDDDTYHSSFTNAVVTEDLDLNITFQPTTLAQFQQDVEGL
jgi:hypothetical protein